MSTECRRERWPGVKHADVSEVWRDGGPACEDGAGGEAMGDRRVENGGGWLRGWLVLGVLPAIVGCGFFVTPGTGGGGGGGGGTGNSGRAYVINATTQSVTGFAVGTATLTVLPGTPYALGYVPAAEVVSRNNAFLYVVGPGTVNTYTIRSDGSLVQATCPGCTQIATVVSLDVSPDGQWLFGLDLLSSAIDLWQLNSSTGAMSTAFPGQFAVGNATVSPKQVRVSPTANVVIASLGTGGDVAFAFNTSTGAFTPAGGNTLATGSTQTSDNAVAIDASGGRAYLARSGVNGGLAVYAIGSTGSLTPVAGSPFATGVAPTAVQLDGTGGYVYTANRTDGTISGFAIGTTGALTALSGSPFTTGRLPGSLALDSTGKYVLATALSGSPDLTLYGFDAAGALTAATTATTGTDPTGATAVATTH